MTRTAVLGYPRLGADRELKVALEGYWAGQTSADELRETARRMRVRNLGVGLAAGIDVLPVGDFAYYDHVLDVAELFTIIDERHGGAEASGLPAHFLACRGAEGVAPLEMTKWFDTNYHYLVPELQRGQRFALRPESLKKWTSHLEEARGLGVGRARPVVLGPFSLLALSKGVERPLDSIERLIPAYVELLAALATAGAAEVQLDEPALVLDHPPAALDAFAGAYRALLTDAPLEVAVTTYFEGLDDSVLERIRSLPLAELHVDLVRAPERLDAILDHLPDGARLSAGVIDGRNVWATDLDRALDRLERIVARIGADRLTIAPSCSLLHVPYNAAREERLDDELRSWLAFGDEKLEELALLKKALAASDAERDELLAGARTRVAARRSSSRTNDNTVRARAAALTPADYDRSAPIAERRAAQERLGLDVLVHGEPERNDMVEYFGEQLNGFGFSQFGWVQSYGSRAVKPPILYGDVSRQGPMTVEWWRYAQSVTERPMKGMLTGPVTILQWSFVRDDQPRHETCLQIGLAIADEVADLEAAGAAIIQIDEAALREGLPLKRADQPAYVRWAIDCFRLAAAGARPETQIHTHMCYSEFKEMIEDIARLDADVISIEASRSGMVLLEAFRDFDYPGQIGPGIYDIHSPRVPSVEEMESLLALAEERIPRSRLWVNPDCGLKTRGWPETHEALKHLVRAAHNRRAEVASPR